MNEVYGGETKTILYKGLFIDDGVTYPGMVTVQFFGDDIMFDSVEDAKNWIDEAESLPGDEPFESYTSATDGDYSPSNPWDAPGMSVSDFI